MRRRKRLLVAVLWTVGLLAGTGLAPHPAYARRAEQKEPQLKKSKPVVEWVLGALFLAGSLVVAFKNPRRSHLT